MRCSKESQHPAEWTTGLQLSCPGERERHNADGHNFRVKIFQLCSVSSSLSHANLEYSFSNPCNKVSGKYFYKEVFMRASLSLRLFIITSVCIQYICICIFLNESANDNTTTGLYGFNYPFKMKN